MEQLINWILGTRLSEWVIVTTWAAPAAEIFHFIGLSLLLGSIFIVDLRLAGFFRSIPIAITHRLIPWAIVGFVINLITGVLFVFGDPNRYSVNIGFQLKMLFILIAGINALWFYWKINPLIHQWDANSEPTALAKLIAWISLSSWVAVLLLGRLIPYVGTG